MLRDKFAKITEDYDLIELALCFVLFMAAICMVLLAIGVAKQLIFG